MQFVNTTGNTILLKDIKKEIPFLGEQPQDITTDEIKRSKTFQILCINRQFVVVTASEDRIEQNLWRHQNGKVPLGENAPQVTISGNFFTNTGYGKANRNLTFALARAGVKVAIETEENMDGTLNQMEIEQIARFRRTLPKSIRIRSAIPSFASKPGKGYNILNTTIEAASVPQQFIDICSYYDEIWVPSHFCKDVLTEYGFEKTYTIIPNAVDTSLYNSAVKPIGFSTQPKGFVFISVMSWSYRKGYDVLLKAYLNEFTENDDTTLLIITKYNGIDDPAEKYIRELTKNPHPHIMRIGREVPEFEMPRIYKSCHCMVLPSRGEGFGLPYVESSLCGLPVIATNHSGHTMFLNNDNAFMLEIDSLDILEAGLGGTHYWDGQMFPRLTDDSVIRSLGATMRYVKDHYDEAKKKNSLLQQNLQRFSLESVGELAAERLKTLWTIK